MHNKHGLKRINLSVSVMRMIGETKMKVIAEQGPFNSLGDVPGIRVGHAADKGARTGVTVVLPEEPVLMSVDVRGGGPGTRDTDACSPDNFLEDFHGLVFSGGSVFGLAAADTVTTILSERGTGLPIGPRPVPVVPSAILYDLANGGDKDWGETPPYQDLARQALLNASSVPVSGRVGAGFGAIAGDRPGGLGMASLCLDGGMIVAAMVCVNSFGTALPTAGGDGVSPGEINLPKAGFEGTNTSIGVIATNMDFTKAQLRRLAIMAQDGLARAIRPIHTPFDGDTIFALSTRDQKLRGAPSLDLTIAGTMASDCVLMAVKNALKTSD